MPVSTVRMTHTTDMHVYFEPLCVILQTRNDAIRYVLLNEAKSLV